MMKRKEQRLNYIKWILGKIIVKHSTKRPNSYFYDVAKLKKKVFMLYFNCRGLCANLNLSFNGNVNVDLRFLEFSFLSHWNFNFNRPEIQ